MFLVFLSGIGFSIQSLSVKLLEEHTGFNASFQIVFWRGFVQSIVSYILIVKFRTEAEPNTEILGPTPYVKKILLIRALVGFGGIAFAFLAVERLPIGDSTVLVMLSPVWSTIFSFFILGEPWRLPEFFAMLLSLVGVVYIAKPAFVFGGAEALDVGGVLEALTASLCAGAAYTAVRMLGTTAKLPWWNVCFVQALGQWMLAIPGFFITQQFQVPTMVELCVVVGTGFLGTWSQIAMTIGMQREKSATATGMRMSDVVFGFLWQVLFTHDNVVSFYSFFGALLVVGSIFVLILSKEGPSAAQGAVKDKAGGGLELREAGRRGGGGDKYNVLHTDEDMDASRGQTAIDISEHSEAAEGEGEVRNAILGLDMDMGVGMDADLYDDAKGGLGLGAFGPRKRQGSAGSDSPSFGGVDVATMRGRLAIAIT